MCATRKYLIVLMLAATSAQAIDAARLMPELVWQKRVLLIFAANQDGADYRQQQTLLKTVADGLIDRDMAVIRVFSDNHLVIDLQSYDQSVASFHQHFAVAPGEFRVILVGKDGTIKLDRDSAVSDDDLFSLIDSMPMRRQEILQGG